MGYVRRFGVSRWRSQKKNQEATWTRSRDEPHNNNNNNNNKSQKKKNENKERNRNCKTSGSQPHAEGREALP